MINIPFLININAYHYPIPSQSYAILLAQAIVRYLAQMRIDMCGLYGLCYFEFDYFGGIGVILN